MRKREIKALSDRGVLNFTTNLSYCEDVSLIGQPLPERMKDNVPGISPAESGEDDQGEEIDRMFHLSIDTHPMGGLDEGIWDLFGWHEQRTLEIETWIGL